MSLDHVSGFIERVTSKAETVHKYVLSGGLEQYRGKPWELVAHLEDYAEQRKIPMLITKAKMETTRDLLAAMDPKPKVIVEFGAYVGSSAVGWAAALRDLNGPGAAGLRVYTFELDPKIAQVAQDLVKVAGVEDIVTVMDGPASESLKKLVSDGQLQAGELDMAFIDHWEKYYVPDLQLCEQLKLFHKGSLVCADNTIHPGAPTYVKYVKAGGSGAPGAVRYESESITVPEADGGSILEVSTVVEV